MRRVVYKGYVVEACNYFFNLSKTADTQSLSEPDKYWGVSPIEIYDAFTNILENHIQYYLPDICLDKGNGSFFATREQRAGLLIAGNYTQQNVQNFLSDITTVSQQHLFPRLLLGISGRRRHGKTTLSEHLTTKHQFIEYAFATPLKLGCKALFGLTDAQITDEEKDRPDPLWGISPRYILQHIGTNLVRNDLKKFLPNIRLKHTLWIENFIRFLETLPQNCFQRVVVSDVRFLDEAEVLRQHGAQIIKVIRPMPHAANDANTHSSELLIDKIKSDYEIINNKTICDLQQKADTCLTNILLVTTKQKRTKIFVKIVAGCCFFCMIIAIVVMLVVLLF